jgi:uncharacterized protein YfaP (DUF2135 family)
MKNQTIKFHAFYLNFLMFWVISLSFLLVSSCDNGFNDESNLADDFDILSQSLSVKFGNIGISDAANDGIDEFYFLAPTVGKQPKYHGKFNPNISPVIEISDDLSFQNIHASFGVKSGKNGKVIVDSSEEKYFVDWEPSKSRAVIGKIYRARVLVANKVLGYVDLGVVSNTKQTLRNGIIPVVENQSFRIAFRIEDKICPARIEVLPNEVILRPSEEIQLRATVYNFFDEVLEEIETKWSVEDESVATIDQNGLLKGVSEGITNVIVRSIDISTTIKVSVVKIDGIVTGKVVDAITGNPISGAKIVLGDSFEILSENDGNFVIEVPQGTYNLIIQKDGYINSNVSGFSVIGNQVNSLGLVALSPNLQTGELRVVLTWNPRIDLDSHLTGPISNSSSRFHVFWFRIGSLNSSPYSYLDKDDEVGPGPETITISQSFDGIYRYSVHDYTNAELDFSTALSNSNAEVRVFFGNDQVASFKVPNRGGTLWKVFELNGRTKEITVFNEMTYISTPESINRIKSDEWVEEISETLKSPKKH